MRPPPWSEVGQLEHACFELHVVHSCDEGVCASTVVGEEAYGFSDDEAGSGWYGSFVEPRAPPEVEDTLADAVQVSVRYCFRGRTETLVDLLDSGELASPPWTWVCSSAKLLEPRLHVCHPGWRDSCIRCGGCFGAALHVRVHLPAHFFATLLGRAHRSALWLPAQPPAAPSSTELCGSFWNSSMPALPKGLPAWTGNDDRSDDSRTLVNEDMEFGTVHAVKRPWGLAFRSPLPTPTVCSALDMPNTVLRPEPDLSSELLCFDCAISISQHFVTTTERSLWDVWGADPGAEPVVRIKSLHSEHPDYMSLWVGGEHGGALACHALRVPDLSEDRGLRSSSVVRDSAGRPLFAVRVQLLADRLQLLVPPAALSALGLGRWRAAYDANRLEHKALFRQGEEVRLMRAFQIRHPWL